MIYQGINGLRRRRKPDRREMVKLLEPIEKEKFSKRRKSNLCSLKRREQYQMDKSKRKSLRRKS